MLLYDQFTVYSDLVNSDPFISVLNMRKKIYFQLIYNTVNNADFKFVYACLFLVLFDVLYQKLNLVGK